MLCEAETFLRPNHLNTHTFFITTVKRGEKEQKAGGGGEKGEVEGLLRRGCLSVTVGSLRRDLGGPIFQNKGG